MILIGYSKCSTCMKAKKFLIENNIKFKEREIKEDIPTYDELDKWIKDNNLNINKLFNTSGLVYRELNLKDKLDSMSYEEKLKLLSSNGMLIKRPLLVDSKKLLVGFKINEWKEYLKI